MKAARGITALIVLILLFSAWPPSPVFARQVESSPVVAPSSPNQVTEPVAIKVVPLWIKNRTGGVLFVTLYGQRTYYFTILSDKSKFLIVPGWYKISAISTGCSGTFEHRKNFKQGGNLVYYCDSQ